jgi:acyl-CoA dehydrogenase
MTNASFGLSKELLDLQHEARELAASVTEYVPTASQASGFVPEIRSALASSGLAAVMVPGSYGGRFPEVSSLAATVVREALAAESGHLDSMFAMQGIGSFAISRAGSLELRERWLPAVGRMDAVPALALSEPEIGSDLKAITTTITATGDMLVLNGAKSFITNAGEADFYCVLGREATGYSLVLVPGDAAGVKISRPHQIIDNHVLGDVVLNDVSVPASFRIGAPLAGFDLVLATLATFRVSVAGAAVGLAEACLREAVEHTKSRELFGTTLSQLGGVPAALAMSWTDIELSRSLAYRAAAAAGRDPVANLHLSSMAKVAASEMAGRVADRAVQLMGRFGLVQGSKIERFYREARPMRIYEGSTEVILDSLARQLLKRTLP